MDLFDVKANYKVNDEEKVYNGLHTKLNISQFFTSLEQKARGDMKNNKDINIAIMITKRDGEDEWQSIPSN